MILWFDYNILDLVNVVMFYLVIISDAINDFLRGDNEDWTESKRTEFRRMDNV